MRSVIVIPLALGGAVLLVTAVAAARRTAAEEQAQSEQQLREALLRTVLAPDFKDLGQALVASAWLDAHGFPEDASRVRYDAYSKFYGGNPTVEGCHVGALSYPTGAAARETIRRTMRAFKRGTLTSRGRPVTSRKQALAIALNLARRRVGAEIGFLPDAPTLLSLLRDINRQLPPRVGGCVVGEWWTWLTPSWWWTLGVTPAGGRTEYRPIRYLSDDAAAEWAMDETERAWNASVQRWKWTGAAWTQA